MKQKLQRWWPWLATATVIGLLCATYLFSQIGSSGGGTTGPVQSQPGVNATLAAAQQEATDAARLLQALSAGDNQTALEILRTYGVADDTVLAMARRLGQTPGRVPLQEPFLKAAVSLSLAGSASDVQARLQTAGALGYGRPVWVARWLQTNWTARCDAELAQSPLPPIGALDVSLDDPNFIQFFLWYDRYAEQLHSVVLNWEKLNTHDVQGRSADVNQVLSGLYKLIKARKPDAFVWVSVVKQDSRTDEQWLRSLTFKPDGLFIANLRQFESPFDQTRRRYIALLGEDLPMVVSGFYGYRPQLQAAGKALSAARRLENSTQRQAAEAQALARIAAIGKVVGSNLGREEQHLQTLGYRGLTVNWRLLEALDQAGKN